VKSKSKAGLAVKLAREAFFGDEIVCTLGISLVHLHVHITELNHRKEEIFGLFPQYWGCPSEFEGYGAVASVPLGKHVKDFGVVIKCTLQLKLEVMLKH